MNFLLKILKEWTLLVAMSIGCLGYKWLGALAFITPPLIFCMLLLTFCKINYRQISFSKMQIFLLAIQILGSVAVYFIIAPFDKIVAQAVMICIIAPTATAASVITSKLRGNAIETAFFTLLSNLAVAFVAPVFFPLISNIHPELSFLETFFKIFNKIVPLLLFPFFIAFVLQRWFPKINRKLTSISDLAFYLWAAALTLAISQTVKAVTEMPPNFSLGCRIAAGSLVACISAFISGKLIGQKVGERISGGQSLGQKNTIIAIWMVHTYLAPAATLGPGCYILWQNIINSWQLYKQRKREKL